MRPTRQLLRIGAAWALLALAACFFTPAFWLWLVTGAVLLGALVLDILRLRKLPALRVERTIATSLPLGIWTDVQLSVQQAADAIAPLATEVDVFDGVPGTAEFEGLPQRVVVPTEGAVQLSYRLRSMKRGDLVIQCAELLRPSPFGLWLRKETAGEATTVRVYPNFSAVAGFALHAVDNRISLMGIRKKPRRGQGLDFHQLRDFIQGDSLRQIDWKATSRHGRTISREFQEERDQQVIFLMDCGRRMRSMDGELSQFDHALNAVLLLSHIALRQGDAVGMMTFSGVDRWLPPSKGRTSLNTILNRVYDLEPTLSPPDYSEAASRMLTLQRRRALVILVTNLRDEDFDDLQPALNLLRRRHLVVLASLRESKIDATAETEPSNFDSALHSCAAKNYLSERQASIEKFKGRSLLPLDLPASELPIALVNRYLDIKQSGAL